MIQRVLPILVSTAIVWGISAPASGQTVPEAIAKWEPDIKKLEKLDRGQQEVRDAVVFVGSSSIRLWKTIESDMKPWSVLKRGYGGAKLSDLNHYAMRLVGPHLGSGNPRRARAVVIFVANDISGKKGQRDPDSNEVGRRFQRLHKQIRQRDRTMPVFWVEVTPTESRWHVWAEIKRATSQIRQVLDRDPYAYFIPTAGAFFGADNRPDSTLFVKDRLHLNQQGYELWAKLIKTQLNLRLGPAQDIDPNSK